MRSQTPGQVVRRQVDEISWNGMVSYVSNGNYFQCSMPQWKRWASTATLVTRRSRP